MRMHGHDGGATWLAFSPDGATLICGEGRGGTRVWDVRTGQLLHVCNSAGFAGRERDHRSNVYHSRVHSRRRNVPGVCGNGGRHVPESRAVLGNRHREN